MPSDSRITATWKPELLSSEVIATGTWSYQGVQEYRAELLRQKWNFTAFDLPRMLEILHPESLDFVDYAVSDEGIVYVWRFTSGSQVHYSQGLSTYFQAREHLESYGSPYDVRWPEPPGS